MLTGGRCTDASRNVSLAVEVLREAQSLLIEAMEEYQSLLPAINGDREEAPRTEEESKNFEVIDGKAQLAFDKAGEISDICQKLSQWG